MQQINERGQIITLIHLVTEVMYPPDGGESTGPPTPQWRIACMPNMTELHRTEYHPNYQRTDSVQAVSCPACKKTAEFKEAMNNYLNMMRKLHQDVK